MTGGSGDNVGRGEQHWGASWPTWSGSPVKSDNSAARAPSDPRPERHKCRPPGKTPLRPAVGRFHPAGLRGGGARRSKGLIGGSRGCRSATHTRPEEGLPTMPVSPGLGLSVPADARFYRTTSVAFRTRSAAHHTKVLNGEGAVQPPRAQRSRGSVGLPRRRSPRRHIARSLASGGNHRVLDLAEGRLQSLNGRHFPTAGERRRSLIPKVGLEPTRVLPHRILSPARLPFRHFGINTIPGCPTRWWLSTPARVRATT